TFDDRYMNWADSSGVSYLAWVWLVDDPPQPGDDTCDRHGLLSSYDGTPLAPNGTAVHDHLTALAASGSSPTTTTGKGKGTGKPAVTLRSFSAAVQPGGSAVKFRLRSAQKCTGTITGQTVNTYAAATVKHKTRKVSLGSVKFSLKAGKSKTVVLKLSKASRKLLAAKRSLKVQITITLTSAGHRRTVLHRTTTLHRKG
ncbi:MAG TPA: hypothetical protein VIY10_22355, partial [Solirubrobacteraceae bacterium]